VPALHAHNHIEGLTAAASEHGWVPAERGNVSGVNLGEGLCQPGLAQVFESEGVSSVMTGAPCKAAAERPTTMKRTLWPRREAKSRSSARESGKTSATSQTPVQPFHGCPPQRNQGQPHILGIGIRVVGDDRRHLDGQPSPPPVGRGRRSATLACPSHAHEARRAIWMRRERSPPVTSPALAARCGNTISVVLAGEAAQIAARKQGEPAIEPGRVQCVSASVCGPNADSLRGGTPDLARRHREG
jgi:hypothetical protein